MSNQSASRNMVPKLPGSRTPSRARYNFPCCGMVTGTLGISTTASAPEGVDWEEILSISFAEIYSAGWSTAGPGKPSSRYRFFMRKGPGALISSVIIFLPSTMNSPNSCRNFLCSRDLICCICALLNMVSIA